MRNEDRIRILHMIEAIEDGVLFHSQWLQHEDPVKRALFQAIIRCIEVLGEAGTKVGGELKAQYPEIEWRVITDMRNWLIHSYHDINNEIVLNTITNDLPPLLIRLKKC